MPKLSCAQHHVRPPSRITREKTSIAHIDEGIEFLGWRIQRQTGRNGRPQIYTYPSKPSLQTVMGKVKQITRWWPTAQTVSLYNPAGVKTTHYRYRGSKIPTPWEQPDYEQLSFDLDRLETLIAR